MYEGFFGRIAIFWCWRNLTEYYSETHMTGLKAWQAFCECPKQISYRKICTDAGREPLYRALLHCTTCTPRCMKALSAVHMFETISLVHVCFEIVAITCADTRLTAVRCACAVHDVSLLIRNDGCHFRRLFHDFFYISVSTWPVGQNTTDWFSSKI